MVSPVSHFEKLQALRSFSGQASTTGIPDHHLAPFLETDPSLRKAIDEAWQLHQELRKEWSAELAFDEEELCEHLQAHFLNFYAPSATNPYVAIAARGPWLVTAHGAVLHDSGGYGMLGLGHAPELAMEVMAKPWVMANVMTASFAQRRLSDRLRAQIGAGECPYDCFMAMNSGSEAVTVALRVADLNARVHTEPGGRHEEKRIKFLSLTGSFHGRTDRPAQASDSTHPKYQSCLATFRGRDNLITVEPNDLVGLAQAFADAESQGVFIECVLLEPVQGEGNPGCSITREFYDLARKLTREHDGLLLVDSIQAGLRAHGCLSIVDYPGFEDCDAPDLETYSKALNAGQYPLSVLALHEDAARFFVRGVYGNTMTTNPRALEVACAVLDALTPKIRANVRIAGQEFMEMLQGLQADFPCVLKVQGTGLLLSALLDERVPVEGNDGLEHHLRTCGLGIIHGARNSLRFTPHFGLSSAEIRLIGTLLREGLSSYLER